MEKLQISGLFSTAKASFKAVVLSSLLAAAFFFNSCCSFAEFSLDTRFADTQVAASVALDVGASFVIRAGLGALGVDIACQSLGITPTDIANVIGFGTPYTSPPVYTYKQSLLDFLNRETIKIRPNAVTIGGVEYSDVWLPHDCADKFRTNAFDFITRYNISSESVGTFVSGVGTIDGSPAYQNSSGAISCQTCIVPGLGTYMYGDTVLSLTSVGANGLSVTVTGQSPAVVYNSSFTQFTKSFNSIRNTVLLGLRNDAGQTNSLTFPGSVYVNSPFDFDWASGIIPATPLPTSDGLRLRVPSSYVAGIPQILEPSSPSYQSDLSNLADSISSAASSDDIESSAFEEWDAPIPTSNTIADEPYSSLSGSLSGIQSVISSISSSVSGIADSIVGADSTFFGNIVSALATPFEPVFTIFRSGVGIWHYVVSWVGTISSPFVWSLTALGSAGSYFLSPIYAAAAAAVVLAVYKKFGR